MGKPQRSSVFALGHNQTFILTEKASMSKELWTLTRFQVKPEEVVLDRTKLLPPYKVIVHDDDYNEMNYVIFALVQAVNTLTMQEAERIMLTAHLTGRAIVAVCPKEVAEYYQERLLSYHLTATIEPE
jgi:ATP-dependent Clp protease adaptor protein ClpS